jgi:hypothetical protein
LWWYSQGLLGVQPLSPLPHCYLRHCRYVCTAGGPLEQDPGPQAVSAAGQAVGWPHCAKECHSKYCTCSTGAPGGNQQAAKELGDTTVLRSPSAPLSSCTRSGRRSPRWAAHSSASPCSTPAPFLPPSGRQSACSPFCGERMQQQPSLYLTGAVRPLGAQLRNYESLVTSMCHYAGDALMHECHAGCRYVQ